MRRFTRSRLGSELINHPSYLRYLEIPGVSNDTTEIHEHRKTLLGELIRSATLISRS